MIYIRDENMRKNLLAAVAAATQCNRHTAERRLPRSRAAANSGFADVAYHSNHHTLEP